MTATQKRLEYCPWATDEVQVYVLPLATDFSVQPMFCKLGPVTRMFRLPDE